MIFLLLMTKILRPIVSSLAPDAIEARQKMREKWLLQVFEQADAERKGMLDEWETINLMKKLNDKLCITSLKQKIMEFDFGKDEEERGRISKNLFIRLFTQTATRPDVYFILVRYQYIWKKPLLLPPLFYFI